jgi:hypothetical protein
MYQITLKADMTKSSTAHKVAASVAKTAVQHVIEHAPSGAHAHFPQDIPAGEYTIEMSGDHHGNVVYILTPGRVP